MRIVVAILLLVGIVGCDAAPTTPDGGRSDGPVFLRARVNGAEFRPEPGQSTVAYGFGIPYFLQATASERPAPSQMTFTFDSVRIGSEQQIRPARPFTPVYVTLEEPNTFRFYLLDSLQPSRLRITRFDPFNRRIAGEFRFRARRYVFRDSTRTGLMATDELLTVTDGVFDLDFVTAGVR